jgi:peptidoglycan/xylan/chitin deacetylase (PgdA/CDA1 family)
MDLRLDRFVTLHLVSPLMRLVPRERLSIPILMYHSIVNEDESGQHAYYRTTTSPTAFASQMRYLHQSGYNTCSLMQAMDLLGANAGDAARTIAKTVVITFDDGYRDFYHSAFPVLNQFGFTATVFLPTAYIGERTLQFKSRDCLTWSEVRELQKCGISFGSHTVTHPQLRDLSKQNVEKELVDSKKAIEEKTGRAVDSFAYPYAFPQADTTFKKTLGESLRNAGYRSGVCTKAGRAGCTSDPLFMERLPINSFDDTPLFQAKLAGAYDWIGRPQSIVRWAKDRAAKSYGEPECEAGLISNEAGTRDSE